MEKISSIHKASTSTPLAVVETGVAIIGSGFSGLGMAHELTRQGRDDFMVFEKASSVGGTWRDNSYPGCACDVQSQLYSYSFAQNSEWSRSFAAQPEIRSYLEEIPRQAGMEKHLYFGYELKSAKYDDSTQRWLLEFFNGCLVSAQIFVSAIGALHIPKIPEIKNIDGFAGEVFHSSQWPADFDPTGKRIAVIGTGASAIQFVPQIVDRAKSVSLFQRTPAWVLPKPDRKISAVEKMIYRKLPLLLSVQRARTYLQLEVRAVAFSYFTSLLKVAEKFAGAHIRKQVRDSDKAEQLTPKYSMGCKRILMSNDYYPALNRDHVAIEDQQVVTATEHGVIDASGTEHEVDVVIYGTGFDTLEAVTRLDIRNHRDESLQETWKNGAHSHYGINVAGYPNLFFLLGPNTGLGHNSQIYMIESQIRYISAALQGMAANKLGSVDVKEDVQALFGEKLKRALTDTVWASGCKSWYLTESGENYTLWPGFTFAYRWQTRDFDSRLHHCELEPGTSQSSPDNVSVDNDKQSVDSPALATAL